ncbi:hypothetical protein BHE74_00049106 [Ensete ventricosum]|nr:hypothetical protein GW17_00057044 [Ensete ventricosum]RWW45092.1 hypothetical protein BHE74_00049106 [Ensete ventricosum]RZS13247.1 hypothetical protein BHM03_00044807 [Ensete ventricosum]
MVSQRRVFYECISKLGLDKSLGYQHMGAVYHQGRSQIASTSESHGENLIIRGMVRVIGELDCFSAHIRLREPGKSGDKAEGENSVESSIPCSHGGRALVVKGTEEVENAETNSKYQDRMEG